MVRIIIILISISLLVGSFGCVAMTANHYQDANALGKGNATGSINLGFGRGIAGISNIDSAGYVTEEGATSTSIPMFAIGAAGSYGINDNLDLGGEVFTTLFSSGLKLFGKYKFTDSTSAIQIAVQGGVGFARGTLSIETSGGFGNSKTTLTHNLISIEVPLLLTYNLSDRASISLSPKIYYYLLSSIDRTEWIDTGLEEEYTASQTILSPAISVGFRYRGIRPEMTFIAVKDLTTDETVWLPLFGVGFYGVEGITKLIAGLFL